VVIALVVHRTTSPIGTWSDAQDHACFCSSGFEHATEEAAAVARRTANALELMIRVEVTLLMAPSSAPSVPSVPGPCGM
jgi:hypothetical protein